jgi:hypothetical protein
MKAPYLTKRDGIDFIHQAFGLSGLTPPRDGIGFGVLARNGLPYFISAFYKSF